MATKLIELMVYLEEIAPLHLQASYDNSGLIVGDPNMTITGVTVCLDSTEEVIEEAYKRGDNVVIAHHPIVFTGLKKFNGTTYIERTIIKAIKYDIAIYAIHTNLDHVLQDGVNQQIAKRIGLKTCEILEPMDSATPNIGAGVYGELPEAIDTKAFLHHIKETMQAQCIKHTNIISDTIKRVAICGGSGSFLLPAAKAKACDIFISSDFKYHQFFDANDEIIIADIGHFETEQFTINLLVEIIRKNFSNFAAHFTQVDTNPVHYI